MPRKTKRINRKTRAHNAALRLIAKQDGISFAEARKLHDQAIVDVIYRRTAVKVARRFLEIPPLSGRYREIPKGKEARIKNARGPVRDVRYLERVRRMEAYWATIRIYQETFHLSLKQARRAYTRKGREEILIDLGGIKTEGSPKFKGKTREVISVEAVEE